jgi:glycosyltransferase involved in cell wall biosynthesis
VSRQLSFQPAAGEAVGEGLITLRQADVAVETLSQLDGLAESPTRPDVLDRTPEPDSRQPEGPLNILTIAACPMLARRGTPVRIERLSEALAARGHRVTVATYHIGEAAPAGTFDIVRIDRPFVAGSLPPGPAFAKFFRYDPYLLATTRRLLATRPFDIIHAHHIEGLLIGALARRRCIPLIYDAHTMLDSELPSYCGPRWRWLVRRVAKRMDGLLPRLADHVVCAGHGTREALIGRHGFAPERVTLAGNGVELEHFAGAFTARTATAGSGCRPTHLLYTGTLAGYQNIELLLEAFALLHRTHPAVRLVIASNSPFAPLAPLAATLGISSAIDILDDDFAALPGQLAAATVAVLPRTSCDGVPQKLLNYMAAGCPVVASEGSAQVLQQEVTGLIVANGDVDAFARAMRRLIDEPPLAAALSRQAHDAVARNASWNGTAVIVEAVYRSLLAKQGRAAELRGTAS